MQYSLSEVIYLWLWKYYWLFLAIGTCNRSHIGLMWTIFCNNSPFTRPWGSKHKICSFVYICRVWKAKKQTNKKILCLCQPKKKPKKSVSWIWNTKQRLWVRFHQWSRLLHHVVHHECQLDLLIGTVDPIIMR